MMKLKYWAMSLLACGGLLACTNEDNMTGENNGQGEGTTSYLAVNIMNAGGPMTRALPGDYEEGIPAENEIKAMRFYLFKADGSAYTLSNNTNCVTTTTYSEDETADQTTSTVEEVGNAVLVINGSTDTPPASIVAILNYDPGQGTDAFANITLTQLKAVTGDYATNMTTSGKFLMSNSVYNNGTTAGEVYVADKVKNDDEAAKLDPVEIYVERVVAKVTVADGRETLATVGTYLVSGNEGSDDAIYAVINGWQVADYNEKSYILKNISSTWSDTSLGITTWSTNDYHRSFWATSVGIDDSNVAGNNSWNNIVTAIGSPVYTQENTGTAGNINVEENDLTKVIVAATLKKKDSNGDLQPTAIYKLYGADYANETAVLTEIANMYARTYFTRTGDASPYTYTSIAPADLEFKTATDLSDNNIKSYYVVAQLKSGITVYKKATGDTYTDATTECNTELKKVPAQIWKEGKTYYYTTIKHLGSKNSIAEYGVVRNHSYKVNIDEIKGLGTPVYDPTEVIIPVTPTEEQSYIAARINILAWRVVSNDVTLGGN